MSIYFTTYPINSIHQITRAKGKLQIAILRETLPADFFNDFMCLMIWIDNNVIITMSDLKNHSNNRNYYGVICVYNY